MSRFRNFSFILYPEDDLADFAWVDWLSSKQVPCLAILHQPEKDEEKPHVHVLVHFDNPTTRKSALEVYSHVHVPQHPDNLFFTPVSSVIGTERYFRHLDSPDKIPYPADALLPLCGYQLRGKDDNSSLQSFEQLYSLAVASPSYRRFVSHCASQFPHLLPLLASRCYFFMSLFD